VQLAIAAKPDDIDLPFWRAVLGYAPMHEDNAIDPLGHGSTVWMQDLNPDKPLRHAMHVDVSVGREEAEERLAAALAAGGRIVEQSEAPAAWILSDRAGNKVCIAAWRDGATAATARRIVLTQEDGQGASCRPPRGHPGDGRHPLARPRR
jgi:4a-hydroxytetrahydrobiopterin dehydratase